MSKKAISTYLATKDADFLIKSLGMGKITSEEFKNYIPEYFLSYEDIHKLYKYKKFREELCVNFIETGAIGFVVDYILLYENDGKKVPESVVSTFENYANKYDMPYIVAILFDTMDFNYKILNQEMLPKYLGTNTGLKMQSRSFVDDHLLKVGKDNFDGHAITLNNHVTKELVANNPDFPWDRELLKGLKCV